MKRKGLLFSVAVLALALLALFSAAAEETGNQPKSAVTVDIGLYKYEIDLGKAVLLEYYGSEKNITVPSSVEYDGVTNKVVRIAGYSAYFVELTEDCQNSLIERTENVAL